MCRMRRFLAFLRSFFHSSVLYTLSPHIFPPTNLPFSLTSTCHLILSLPLSLVVSKFIYNTFLDILFSSILCTCPNQRNLFNLTVSLFLTFCWPCISAYLSRYLTNLMHKILFYNRFYFMPLHVSSTCAHLQEVKIALHSLWYHLTYMCDDTRGRVMQFWPPDDEHIVQQNLCIQLVKYCDSLTVCYSGVFLINNIKISIDVPAKGGGREIWTNNKSK